MLPEIKLELNTRELFEVQARAGNMILESEEVAQLSAAEHEKFIDILRNYSIIVQRDITARHAVKPVPKEPTPKPAVSKAEVLKKFNENFEKAFGRKPKRIA